MTTEYSTFRPSKLLTDWADRGANPDTLRVWMRGGGDFAEVGSNVPPFFQILRAIPDRGDEQRRVRRKLAEGAAQLLKSEPDCNLNVLGANAAEILYNLLYLCAGLQVPDILAEPLEAIRRRGKLSGSWNGVSFKRALREAIIENQRSSTALRRIWIKLLQGKPDRFLEGDAFDGFRGLVNATDSPGEPNIPNISRALSLTVKILDGKEHRRSQFKERAAYVDSNFEFRGGLSSGEWFKVAKMAKLPHWAAESLPKLWDLPPEGKVVVWAPILTCIPFPYRVLETLCDGAVLVLDPSPEARNHIQRVWLVFEESRRQFTYESPRAKYCLLNQIFMDLENDWPFIRGARKRLLEEALNATSPDLADFNQVSGELAAYSQQFEAAN